MVVRRSIAVPLERVQEALMLLICPVAGLCFRWAVTFFLELRQFNMELFNLDTRTTTGTQTRDKESVYEWRWSHQEREGES